MTPAAAPASEPAPCTDDACRCAAVPARTPVAETARACGCLPAAGAQERPGYSVRPFVKRFLETAAGPVPVVKTTLGWRDRLGTIGARLGTTRNNYSVAPGLYAAGDPGAASPVLVTANYKLSFDTLRRHLAGLDAWVLVLDTAGVNVWCAAGKGTFAAAELVRRIASSGLARVVSHRTLVLPQLGASGVSAVAVQKQSGFSVAWGPVRAEDIPAFLAAGMRAAPAMRLVRFPLAERLVLIPVELSVVVKHLGWAIAAAAAVSGIGPGGFSLDQAAHRGAALLAACTAGVVAGCVFTPALLPWIPGTAFAAKGALAGAAAGAAAAAAAGSGRGAIDLLLMVVCAAALGSFLAMNFTGATPFTSPSGVEKEMRRAIPLQAAAMAVVVIGWVAAAFLQ